MAVLLLSGCATIHETPVMRPTASKNSQLLRVAVLPPEIHPSLLPGNLKPDRPFYHQLLDGRGVVVTSSTASRDIALELVAWLTAADQYDRIFTVADEEEARKLGANALMSVRVWDYRTVQLGSNRNYATAALLSPLMSQYWIRWRTLEARLDWQIALRSIETGDLLFRNQLKKSYTAPVRSAFGKHFTNKMLSFLQNRAAPDYIGELFGLEMAAIPEKPSRNPLRNPSHSTAHPIAPK